MAQKSERSARDQWVPIKLPEGWNGRGLIPGSGRTFQAQRGEVVIVTLQLKLARPVLGKGETFPLIPFKCLLKARINDAEPDDPLLRWGLAGYFEEGDNEDGKSFRQVWRVPVNRKERWLIWLEVTRPGTTIMPDDNGYWLTRLGPYGSIPLKSEPVDDSEIPSP